MYLEFDLGPLRVKARYSPAVPARRVGHPDRWTEGEGEEIEILSVDGETDDDLEAAVREEARRVADDRLDAWIARQEDP